MGILPVGETEIKFINTRNKAASVVNKIILLTCVLMVSCAGYLGINKGPDFVLVKLSGVDSLALNNSMEKGWELARQDLFIAEASDTLIKYLGIVDTSDFQYYLYAVVDESEVCRFGKLINDEFIIRYEVHYDNGRLVVEEYDWPLTYGRPSAQCRALALARRINDSLYAAREIPYNFWVLDEKDSIYVYHSPGSIQSFYCMCGGIRTTVSDDGREVIRNEIIHKSEIMIDLEQEIGFISRTSLMGRIINEVDVAQTYIARRFFPAQSIFSGTYFFTFKFTPNGTYFYVTEQDQ